MGKSKLIRKIMLAGCTILMMSFAHACTACESEPPSKDKTTFSENLVAELGKEYNPEIGVDNGSTLYSVKLYDENGNEVALKEDYKFVPESIGQYYYKVVVETEGVREEKNYTVVVLDVAAPTIVTSLTALSAEVGVYSGFESDMDKIEIVDDNTAMIPYITKKAVAITFNGTTEENAEGYEQYFFKETGEYKIKVAVTDISGNTAYTNYIINAVDTSSPIVDVFPIQYVWLDEQSEICLPTPFVHDVSNTNVRVEAKRGEDSLVVTNGKVLAKVNDVITVTYTVEDTYKNATIVETFVKVLNKGQLIDKSDELASELFTARDGVVEYDNGISLVSEKNSDVLEWLDGSYLFNAIAGFNSIAFTFKNQGQANVELCIAAKQKGERVYIGAAEILPTGEETTCIFDLSNYTLDQVDGWAIEMKSLGSLNITLAEGYYTQFNDDDFTTPNGSQTETVTEKKAYLFSNVYNGGFVKNTNDKYVKNGAYSAKAVIEANGNVGVLFQDAPYTLTNENYLSFSVYTNTAGVIQLGVVLGDEYKEYKSGEIKLERGWNAVGFMLDKTNSNFNGKSLKGIFCYNLEKYDNLVYLDDFVFMQKESLADKEVFAKVDGLQADTAKMFTIPDIVICDSKLMETVEVSIKDSTGSEIIQATLGETVSLDGFSNGEYRIVYTVLDVFGDTHEQTVKLTVKSDLLSGKIGLKTYRVNENIILPEPMLTSGTYTQSDLKNAIVRKYYRAENGLEWIPVIEQLKFTECGYYDIKYTVALNDVKISITEKTYIHEQGVYFDFETYENGANMGGGLSSGRGTWISDEWSRSGKYSLYINAGVQGMGWSGVDFNRSEFQFASPVDTIVFWAYSEIDRTTCYVGVGLYPNAEATGLYYYETDVKIKAGIHKYVVKLAAEVTHIDRLYFEVNAFENMYIDDVSFVHSPTVEFPDINEKEFLSRDTIQLPKPKLLNVNPIAFTENDVAATIYTVDVESGGNVVTHTITGDNLNLKLKKGNYNLTFTVRFGAFVYVSEQMIFVRDLDVNFIEPSRVYQLNEIYEIQMPEVEEEGVTLSAYYRKLTDDTWTSLSIENGKAKLTLTDVGNYEIKLLAEKDELFEEAIYKVLVREENTIFDLELNADGEHYGVEGNKLYNGIISTEWSYDGKYSVFVSTQGHTFFRFGNVDTQAPERIELGGTYNTITMWIYSDHEMTDFVLEPWIGRGVWLKSAPTTIKVGVHQYVFTFNESFDTLRAVGFEIKHDRWTNFYIDCVQVYNVEVKTPEVLKKQVHVGEKLIINAADIIVDADGLEASTVVKYEKVDTMTYTQVTEKNGEYVCIFETEGSYKLVIEITVGGTSFAYEYSVVVLGEKTDPWIEDTTWN